MPSPHPHLAALQDRLVQAYAQALAGATDCALLDFPDHTNVGDSAIWLGEIVLLARAGVRVRYAASRFDFSLPALRRNLPRSGVVLIHGGGNFGTLYPAHQAHREALLRDCADLPVVQLPQSICYDDDAALPATARAIAAHPRFTLMVRDRASERTAAEALGARTVLCPDSALMLAGSLRRAEPSVDCLVLAREDQERAGDGLVPALQAHAQGLSLRCGDWLEETTSAPLAAARWLRPRLRRVPLNHALWQQLVAGSCTMAARARVQRGLQWIGRGRVVITDRLHGMILSVAAGIPCVALDNRNGKVAEFHRLWLAGLPGCELARSPAEAVAIARRLLAGGDAPSAPPRGTGVEPTTVP